MRTILIALALVVTLCIQLRAEPKLEASSFTVSVNLTDGATGACWTGVRDVRQYIEEKLQEIGFKLGHFHTAEASKNQYVFEVSVFAKRQPLDKASLCDGGVQIGFRTSTLVHGQVHIAQLTEYLINGSNPDWNDTALSLVGLTIKEIENYFQ